ncbi:MAG: HAD-IB family hydrolase [Deltaproteobacteria bacterium]|nr:HAD-IB family hydrolase [Deltaproteobacteria bacterium]
MPDSTGNRPAAFFDLDKTLLAVNSGKLWINNERKAGRLPFSMALRGMSYLVLYHFGFIDMDKAMSQALGTIKGIAEKEVDRITQEWFYSVVAPHEAPGARGYLEAHRMAGHPLVLLTSSSPYESRCAQKFFGMDARLHSHYEIQDGVFTGRFVPPLCYGDGKVHYAREYATQEDIDLGQSYFYTDSYTDLPVLEIVGNPRIVSPDPRLRRVATRRGWPILDWSRETKGDNVTL